MLRYEHLTHQPFMQGQIVGVPRWGYHRCPETHEYFDLYQAELLRRERGFSGDVVLRRYEVFIALKADGDRVYRPLTRFRCQNSVVARFPTFPAAQSGTRRSDHPIFRLAGFQVMQRRVQDDLPEPPQQSLGDRVPAAIGHIAAQIRGLRRLIVPSARTL